jgi:CheY-like chemotaxis protein
MELPLQGMDLSAEALAARPTEVASDAPVVLVASGEAGLCETAHRSLTQNGLQVVCTSTGQEVLDRARKIGAAAILLDVALPDMGGWSVLQLLKDEEVTAAVPVVMLTKQDDSRTGRLEYVTKPLDRAKLLAILQRAKPEASAGRALIVDDDDPVREMLRRSVEKEEWVVTEAENGIVALEQVASSVPDLILLDLDMPAMNGFECLRRLRANQGTAMVPVVVLSGKDMPVDERVRLGGYVEHTLQGGADDADSLIHIAALILQSTRGTEDAAE